jgi:HK97 family phage prohead protease
MAAYDHIDFKPPSGVRTEAKRGLEWRDEFGRGGTAVGVARARDLSNGKSISPDTARRMKSYFARHEVDKQGEGFKPGEAGFPSAGRIAWALWGGDAGQAWSNKLVKQIDAADERDGMSSNVERRFFSLAAESPRMLRVEQRDAEDGGPRPWIVGYAATFHRDSLDGAVGDFVECIAPGAFRNVIDAGTCKALWNHNSDYPLASPRNLLLSEDDVGLRFEFPVSRASYAIDVLHNIEDGVVEGNSFAFVCGRDKWEMDEQRGIPRRTVLEVASLWDVGPVTYPAYGDGNLDVAMRSLDNFRRAAPRPTDARRRAIGGRVAALRSWLESQRVR